MGQRLAPPPRRAWCVGVACVVVFALRAWRAPAPAGGAARAPSGGGPRAIPRVVWRTWRDAPLGPAATANLARFAARNPAYAQRLVNDSAAAAFVRARFPGRVARAFASIDARFGAARADLWRYCVLYAFGGWYLDVDVDCAPPLDALARARDGLAFGYEHARLP